MKKKVAVLRGGCSVEREVSLSSARNVLTVMGSLDYDVVPIDVSANMEELVGELLHHKPDVVLNLLHGRGGEDGCIQGLLEMMEIPYSHSGVLGSALAMNKVVAKQLCHLTGIQVPHGVVATLADVCAGRVMSPPYVIKPIGEGSSIGVYVVKDKSSPLPAPEVWPFDSQVLVETYIPGRELTVAVLDGKALGSLEMQPVGEFADYEAKYTPGKAVHIVPAPLSAEVHDQLLKWAEEAHRVLHCRGLSRSDFLYDETDGERGKLYYLETNSQPGMTATSFVPDIASHQGMTLSHLVQWMVEDASCRR